MPSKPKKAPKAQEPTIYEIQEVAFEATEYVSRMEGLRYLREQGGTSSERSKRGREDASSDQGGRQDDLALANSSSYAPHGLLKYSKPMVRLSPTDGGRLPHSGFSVAGPHMLIKQVIALVHVVHLDTTATGEARKKRAIKKKALVEWSNGTVGWTYDVDNILDEHKCLQRFKLIPRLAPNMLVMRRRMEVGSGGAIRKLCREQLSRWVANEFNRWGKIGRAPSRKDQISSMISAASAALLYPCTAVVVVDSRCGKRTLKTIQESSPAATKSAMKLLPPEFEGFPIQVQDTRMFVHPCYARGGKNKQPQPPNLCLNVQFFAGLASDPWSIRSMTLDQLSALTRKALIERRRAVLRTGKQNIKQAGEKFVEPLQEIFCTVFKKFISKGLINEAAAGSPSLEFLRIHLCRSITAAIRRAVLTRICLAVRLVKLMKGGPGGSGGSGGGGSGNSGLVESQRRMGVTSESDLLFLSILQWYEEQDSPGLLIEWASAHGVLPFASASASGQKQMNVSEKDFLRPLMMDSEVYNEAESVSRQTAANEFLKQIELECSNTGGENERTLLLNSINSNKECKQLLSTLGQLLIVSHDFPVSCRDLPKFFCHVGPEDIVWSVEIPNLLVNKTELGIPSSTAPQSGRVSSMISSLPTFDVKGTKDPGVAGVGLGPLGVTLGGGGTGGGYSSHHSGGGGSAPTTRGTKKGGLVGSGGTGPSFGSMGSAGTSLLDQIGGMGVALKPGADRAIKVPHGKPIKQDVGMIEAIKSVRAFMNEHKRTPTTNELYSVRQWM